MTSSRKHISIERQSDTYEPIWCQLSSKTLNWNRIRIIRVSPLKIFWWTSRPMRSQLSELSTNEKPRFQPDFCFLPNLESTNPMTIGQSKDILMPLKCQSQFANRIPVDIQSDANWHLIWYQLTANQKPINNQLTFNVTQIDYQSTSNQIPIWYLMRHNQMLIDNQSDVNWEPIWRQLRPNLMPIELPINC